MGCYITWHLTSRSFVTVRASHACYKQKMTISPRPDHAGVLVPAPVIYMLALGVGLLLQLKWPVLFIPKHWGLTLGCLLVLASIPIIVSTLISMKKAQTAFDARKSTTSIISEGMFRYTRNPTYVSLTLLGAGVSTLLCSIWMLCTLVIAVVITHWSVIKPEERYLTEKFGAEYLQYAQNVRRWV